eukprot:g46524.t1
MVDFTITRSFLPSQELLFLHKIFISNQVCMSQCISLCDPGTEPELAVTAPTQSNFTNSILSKRVPLRTSTSQRWDEAVALCGSLKVYFSSQEKLLSTRNWAATSTTSSSKAHNPMNNSSARTDIPVIRDS